MEPENDSWFQMIFLFNLVIFRFHVNLPGVYLKFHEFDYENWQKHCWVRHMATCTKQGLLGFFLKVSPPLRWSHGCQGTLRRVVVLGASWEFPGQSSLPRGWAKVGCNFLMLPNHDMESSYKIYKWLMLKKPISMFFAAKTLYKFFLDHLPVYVQQFDHNLFISKAAMST